MRIEEIAYEADGLQLLGHLAVDDSVTGPRPAVLVGHEGPGLDAHAKAVTERLASLGYVAFALDYNGGGKPLPSEQIMDRLGPLIEDNERIRALGKAGLDVLLSQDGVDSDRVAAIGFCFGGTMALELGRSGANLKAIVGFHSGLKTSRPEDAKNITGKVLVLLGAEDPIIPPEQRAAFVEEMRAGGVDWGMNLYGGAQHAFTNPRAADFGIAGIEYHATTAQRSWQAMLDLFDETFPI